MKEYGISPRSWPIANTYGEYILLEASRMKVRRFIMNIGSSWGIMRPGRTITQKLKYVQK